MLRCPASYHLESISMFQGNPLIEALPPRVEEDEIIKQLQHRPPYSDDQRLVSREDRGMLVQILLRLFQPFENDIDIYRRIERCIRWAYADRNPFNPAFIRQQQHEYRAQLQKAIAIPYTQTYPTTSGFALLGISGLGKSTTLQHVLHRYPQVIEHSSYHGVPFNETQITWIHMDCPNDGSLKGLCSSFFEQIDNLLDTSYQAQYSKKKVDLNTMQAAMARIARTYHIRSGNATDNATLHQLFDQKRSLHTTVLSPFPMRFASQWPDSFDGFSRNSILMNHTAYPFYRVFHFCSNDTRSSYAADRFFMAMYNNCCTESKKLRYCPKCAQVQWQNLGASYWQILPQINGYEICPLHNEPIRETCISHRDIRYNFFPASNVLGKPEPGNDNEHIRRVKENRKQFLQIALDISFLHRCSYYGFNLGAKIQKVLQYDLLPRRHDWVRAVLNDPVIYECSDWRDLDALDALVHDPYKLISQIRYVNVCIQLRMCRVMFGDIEDFCNICI